MRCKTLFRVLLKAIGVWFRIHGTGYASMGLAQLIGMRTGSPTAPWLLYAGPLTCGVVEVLLGAYLFLGGRWIANLAIPGNRPYCPECGYDLSRGAALECPECGTAIPRARSDADEVPPPERRS